MFIIAPCEWQVDGNQKACCVLHPSGSAIALPMLDKGCPLTYSPAGFSAVGRDDGGGKLPSNIEADSRPRR
jgi:hypothetical protein